MRHIEEVEIAEPKRNLAQRETAIEKRCDSSSRRAEVCGPLYIH